MKMMLIVKIPAVKGSQAIHDGTLPKTVMGFIEKMKPEGSYFTTEEGKRAAYFFFDLSDATQIPSIAEPFFGNLDAEIELKPVMTAQDLKAGIEKAFRP